MAAKVQLVHEGPCGATGYHRGTRLRWRCRCQGWARWRTVGLWEECRCGHTQQLHQAVEA